MADNQKYYYMRLKDDFFDSEELKLMEAMPDGYLYSNILLKLYLLSLKDNGRLCFKGTMPYSPEMVASITRHQVGTVKQALQVFRQMELIDVLDSGVIYMLNIQNFIGQSSTEADRQRKYYNRIQSEKTMSLPDGKKSCKKSDKKSCEVSVPDIRDKRLENRDKRIESRDNNISSHGAENSSMREPGEIKPKEPAVITLILNTKEEYPIYQYQIDEWAELYPAVDIMQELRSMRGWLDANPKKRKTKKGILRFVNAWLAKRQDRGGSGSFVQHQTTAKPQQTSGNAFAEYLKNRQNTIGTVGYREVRENDN